MKRRDFFKKLGAVAAVSTVLPTIGFAADSKPVSPNKLDIKSAIDAITGGKSPSVSKLIKLKVPQIAENGAVVPVTVEVESPMTKSDYVKSIHILAAKNGNARCLDVNLTPANGKAMVSTRIKLSGTQDVVVIVELSNGKFIMASANIKVTIGGCG